MLRAPASLQCRVGGASVPRSARLAVPLCWQCSKGSAAVSLPQWCPTALQCWRGGSPESPQCPVALQCPAALQCRTGSIPRVPCVPAVLDGQQSCIPAASCVPEVMAAAVPAVQAVMDGRELYAGSAPCPCSAGCMAALHPCSKPWPSIPAWVAALRPCSVLCPWVGVSSVSFQCPMSLQCQMGVSPTSLQWQMGVSPTSPQGRQKSPFGAPISAVLAAACSARVSLLCVAGSAPALVAHNVPVFGW